MYIEHVNKEYYYKIYKGFFKNISIKYKYTETIKVLAGNINTQENRRLQMNKSDKTAIKEDR